jgi:chromosome partitioning protein
MRTVSIANQKGGVGKTSVTVNLAAELARLGQRVLVVDMDAQCNATSTLCGESRQTGDIYRVLNDWVSVSESIKEVSGNLWILPGSQNMQLFDSQDEGKLKRALAGVRENFDLCIIDNPPALDNKTVNSFVASDFVLIVTEPDTYSQNGIKSLLCSIREVRRAAGGKRNGSAFGVVVNKANNRRGLNRSFQSVDRARYGCSIFETAIGDYTQVPLAAHAGKPLCEAYPKCRVRTQFRSVAKELLQRLESVR